MLRSLTIQNILIIDRLELDFKSGLNVLTGETGAGKSILLDSLGFVLGWRGRADLVRQGAERGEVTAEFSYDDGSSVAKFLADAEFEPDGELILRRTNSKDGRKQAFVNDRRVSGEFLKQLSGLLVELHGQHDDRGLTNSSGHRGLLDSFAGADTGKVRAAWAAKREAEQALSNQRKALEEAKKEEEFLRHAAKELSDLEPKPGEDAELDIKRRTMQASAKIRDDVVKANQRLGLEGAEGALSDARRWLEAVADKSEGLLDPSLAALERAVTELGEATQSIDDFLSRSTFEPSELERVEERLFAIRALSRKHNVLPDELATFASKIADRLSSLEQGEGAIAKLEAELEKTSAAYDQTATALSDLRQKAARKLDKAVMAELAPLKLERAVFETQIEQAEPGPHGVDEVMFSVATNPGAPAGPLSKIASGGELSRFLLALKVCLTRQAQDVTLIFDEIDRGVGGATADAVGKRLSNLSETGQILVVTHSPQVAAQGHHHWKVSKQVKDNQTLSDVAELGSTQRVEELARMLAGDQITEEAKRAAKVLLAG